jgi:hypothetical protein
MALDATIEPIGTPRRIAWRDLWPPFAGALCVRENWVDLLLNRIENAR